MGAVIYARVSSKEQADEGFSIPAQLKLLREYAAKHELRVAREFVEAETAKKAGRRGFSAMVSFLKEAQQNPMGDSRREDRPPIPQLP
jgi:site-specific DNA recombinase